MTEQLGGMVMIALVILAILLVIASPMAMGLRWVVAAGLVMRVVGTLTMLAIIFGIYGGVADANSYFNRGLEHWGRMLAGDFGMITNSREWSGGDWWGSHLMYVISAPIAGVLGRGRLGAFLFASLVGFAGLVLIAAAYRRSYPGAPLWRYAAWLFLFPSLWLWPSVLGKEAFMLLGLGLLVFGFCRPGRVAWLPTAAGVVVIFCIRPQVAALTVSCMILAEWMARGRWTPLRVAQTVVILAAGSFFIIRGLSLVGIGEAGMEGVGDYLEHRARTAEAGRTAVEQGEVAITAIPNAIVTTLFRPFPWEVPNAVALGSALEIWFLWGMVALRWRRVLESLRYWRRSRFLAFGLPFVLLYAAAFGMIIVNMGIIVRQRIFLLPFLFALVEGARPVVAAHATRRRAPRQPALAVPLAPVPAPAAGPPAPR